MEIIMQEGTFRIPIQPQTNRQKIKVEKQNHSLYYDITEYNVFPLNFGDGTYRVILYEQVSGTKYKQTDEGAFSVRNVGLAPYLHPNQYVNYVGLKLPVLETTVQQYIKRHYTYDYVRVVTTQPGQLPDIEYALTNKRGICQDLAALATALFRVQGIPARLVMSERHAWLHYYKDKWFSYDPTAALLGRRQASGKIIRHY